MALHPNFPKSPYAILDPDIRSFTTKGFETEGVYRKDELSL